MMTKSRRRPRFGSRLEELHEADKESASEFSDLAISFFAPALIAIVIAVVVSLETWLKPYFRGLEHVAAAAVLIACVGLLLWRRRHRN